MKFFNRYTQELEEEKTPNETCLYLIYTTRFGHFLLHLLLKRVLVSKIFGLFMNLRISRRKIASFVQRYNIDLSQFEEKPNGYKHFNDFFRRKFRYGVRPICADDDTLCFPAEGRHIGFADVDFEQTFFVKGKHFTLEKLVNNRAVAEYFRGGSCVISRLSPVDYHRFHFPCDCVPQKSYCINGTLLSVHPIALREGFRVFCENKRWMTVLKSETLGTILMLEVGATLVGSVKQTFKPFNAVKKGAEKGFFSFGGSTVITIFERGRVELSDDLLYCTQRGFELYAHVGDFMGQRAGVWEGCYAELSEDGETFIE